MSQTTTKSEEPVTIKKYANRRLYNTGTSTYVTLEDLAAMVKTGEDFVVYDAKTGEDITRSVLTQIIFEQENKEGQNLPPIAFLRQLIRFYGDSMQMLVPALSGSLHRVADPRAGEIPRADGAGVRGGRVSVAQEQVRRNMGNVRARLHHVRAVCPAREPGRGARDGTGQGRAQGSAQGSANGRRYRRPQASAR